MKFLRGAAGVLFIVMAATFVSAADQTNPREQLDTSITEGVRLLEAKEYVTFLKNFVPPEELNKQLEKGTLEQIAEKFGGKKSERLLTVLKEIQDAQPTMEDDGKKATYKMKQRIGSKDKITFVKIDKYWYIQN